MRADLEAKSLDFVVKDNCDPKALNMEDSKDRAMAEGRKGSKAKTGDKSVKKAKSKAKSDKKKGKKKQNTKGETGAGASSHGAKDAKKGKKSKKHEKRKGKRHGSGIIADFDPLQI